jgi:hypothetical protein
MMIYLLVALFAAGLGFLGGYGIAGSEYRPLRSVRHEPSALDVLPDESIVEPKVVRLPFAVEEQQFERELEEPTVAQTAHVASTI